MDKIVIITGPTGVGKTKCSLEIAKHYNTEIINGDAYCVYKNMNIGTAKPTIEEQKNIKHHLIDIIDPTDDFSVADYQNLVRSKIDDFKSNNLLPLIVGGSGLYLESIFCNYHFDEQKRDEHFLDQFKDYSNEKLYEYLKNENPILAKNIHPNNRKRVLRAIEIAKQGNYESHFAKNEFVYDALVIFLNDDREVLYKRINQRVDEMVNNGLVVEVESLYPNQFSLTSKGAIGYKELFDYFDHIKSLNDCIDKIKQNSRNYAKRQLTWFRNKNYVEFVNIDIDYHQTVNQIITKIDNFLKAD